MVQRVCFELQVKPERVQEYRQSHAEVWPEMLVALHASGWRNYSLFLRADGLLIGYVEADDVDAALAAMSAQDVNTRWQVATSELLVGGGPDADLVRLPEVFHLADQLVTAGPAVDQHQSPSSVPAPSSPPPQPPHSEELRP